LGTSSDRLFSFTSPSSSLSGGSSFPPLHEPLSTPEIHFFFLFPHFPLSALFHFFAFSLTTQTRTQLPKIFLHTPMILLQTKIVHPSHTPSTPNHEFTSLCPTTLNNAGRATPPPALIMTPSFLIGPIRSPQYFLFLLVGNLGLVKPSSPLILRPTKPPKSFFL